MSDPINSAFTSPNFAFLRQYDAVLVRHAALAERYVFDDPNSALIKLRQLGELLAQHAAAYAGIVVEERDSQHELLDRLRDRQIINAQVAQLFHGLRKVGNQAAHQHTGERREALHQLQMARKLAVWVNDIHADLVVRLLKDAFDDHYGPVPDDTVTKITGAADQPSQLLRRYKNEPLPKVAVTVDLLTTGVDVPEIVNVVFLRRVRSRILFEQMLGRATRLCPDLHGPGDDKARFSIFDAVGIYDALQEVTDMHPVVSRPSMTFTQLTEELQGPGDETFRIRVTEELLAKLRRKRFTAEQEEALVTSTGLHRRQLLDHVRQATPQDIGQWFAQHPAVVDLLDDVYHQGTQFLISEHADALRRIERGYGTATRPEDYLDAFRRFIAEHVDQIPALLVVTQRPRDLTRAQLRDLRLQLDQAGFSEAHLRTAWRETTNQDIAASVIGFIRHVAVGQPLLAHRERVQVALQTILASRPWTAPQRQWLERIGKQLEQEVVVDREAIDSGQFKAMGGYQRLNRIFQGQLDDILHDLAEAMWQAAA